MMVARHDARPYAQHRGYTAAWNKASVLYRKQHPLCEICAARGMTVVAAEVHHKTPIKAGGRLLDQENMQSLCKSCHQIMTKSELGQAVRRGCDENGWPIDPGHAWNALR